MCLMNILNDEKLENELKDILSIPDHLKFAYSCRLGYPSGKEEDYLRVRREVNDFAHHNRYGNKDLK